VPSSPVLAGTAEAEAAAADLLLLLLLPVSHGWK
jgi:hypothetical protein